MKGPHGKGTQPSDWGLGAARAERKPRKTVLKRVNLKVRFIVRKHDLREAMFVMGFLWSFATQIYMDRNGEGTAQVDVGHGISKVNDWPEWGQIPGSGVQPNSERQAT